MACNAVQIVAKIENSGLQPAVLIDSDEILILIILRYARIAFSQQSPVVSCILYSNRLYYTK